MIKNKFLQIGGGSMGTRRIRDLTARGDVEVALFDARADRRDSAAQKFGIACCSTLADVLAWEHDALVISTPPDEHDSYIEMALDTGKHFFCEADIWTYDCSKVNAIAAEKRLVAAPSCTLRFVPAVREMKRIVEQELGALHAYAMCLSVDAPAWHPQEGAEYYARRRSTAPAREMVPFELIGLNDIFGEPCEVSGTVKRRGSLEMDSEDTWGLQMTLDNGATGQLAVFMASPHVVRQGWAVGTNGFVEFNPISGDITRNFPGQGIKDTRNFGPLKDVLESVYAAEINAFVEAVKGEAEWPFSYSQSAIVTATLATAEKSALTGRIEKVRASVSPALLPDQYDLT